MILESSSLGSIIGRASEKTLKPMSKCDIYFASKGTSVQITIDAPALAAGYTPLKINWSYQSLPPHLFRRKPRSPFSALRSPLQIQGSRWASRRPYKFQDYMQKKPSAWAMIANSFPPDLVRFWAWIWPPKKLWCKLVVANLFPPNLWGYVHGFGYWLMSWLWIANLLPPDLWGYAHGFGYWLV